MKRVIDNYESLLQLWEECLEEKLAKKQRQGFWFARAKWNIYIYIFWHKSIIEALCNDR